MYNKYPSKLLTEGEEVVQIIRPHFRALIVPGLIFIATMVGLIYLMELINNTIVDRILIVIALILFLFGTGIPFLKWLSTQYVFTNRRLITRSGIIARNGRDIPLNKINNVSFNVTIMGRILNYGTVIVESAADLDDVIMKNIGSPQSTQKLIYHLYEEEEKNRLRTLKEMDIEATREAYRPKNRNFFEEGYDPDPITEDMRQQYSRNPRREAKMPPPPAVPPENLPYDIPEENFPDFKG